MSNAEMMVEIRKVGGTIGVLVEKAQATYHKVVTEDPNNRMAHKAAGRFLDRVTVYKQQTDRLLKDLQTATAA